MRQDKRWLPRYASRKDVVATLVCDGLGEQRGGPVDISCGGAYLGGVQPAATHGKILLSVPGPAKHQDFLVERGCDILSGRTTAQGGCAIRFHQPLSGAELAKFAADASSIGSMELALRDYSMVHQEVLLIQSCRSTLFVGTMAAIATWLMGATGLVVTNNLKNVDFWAVIGTALPYVLLTIAVLTTIEKTRALNFRRGFLAALTEYIRHDVAPPNYLGWSHLCAARTECRARMAAHLCPDTVEFCWEAERDTHKSLTRGKHLVSNIFDSFTAFSTAVYGFLYMVTVLILVCASLSWLSTHPWRWAPIVCAGIEGAIVFGLAAHLLRELWLARKGKHSIEAQFLTWRAAFRHCRPIGGA